MKKLVALMVASIFVLGLVGTVMAADVPKEMKADGKVAAVDEEASTITVDTKDGEVVVVLGADDMKDAKKGMRARVTYHEEDGKNVADKVKLKPPRKAAQGC